MTGLRAAVEALADEWDRIGAEGLPHYGCLDMHRYHAGVLRDALDAARTQPEAADDRPMSGLSHKASLPDPREDTTVPDVVRLFSRPEAVSDNREMKAFVAGWFAHARSPDLVEDAWHAYRTDQPEAADDTLAERVAAGLDGHEGIIWNGHEGGWCCRCGQQLVKWPDGATPVDALGPWRTHAAAIVAALGDS